MQQLRAPSDSVPRSSAIEISAFEMFTLINGIHCLVWNATRFETGSPLGEANSGAAPRSHNALEASSILGNLQEDFSAHTIQSLAAKAGELSGTGCLAAGNRALDRWMQWWNAKK